MVKKLKEEKQIYSNALDLLNTSSKTKEESKIRTTFYIDRKIYNEFKALCENKGVPISKVIEQAMVDLLQKKSPDAET